MKVQAFLSYSREEKRQASQIASAIRAAGITLWVDYLDIPPAAEWDVAIEEALRGCTHVVLLLSPAAVESANVLDEVSFALEEGKTVIPVILKPCVRPLRIRRLQYIDCADNFEWGVRQLRLRLEADSDPIAERSAPDEQPLPERKYGPEASRPTSREKFDVTVSGEGRKGSASDTAMALGGLSVFVGVCFSLIGGLSAFVIASITSALFWTAIMTMPEHRFSYRVLKAFVVVGLLAVGYLAYTLGTISSTP